MENIKGVGLPYATAGTVLLHCFLVDKRTAEQFYIRSQIEAHVYKRQYFLIILSIFGSHIFGPHEMNPFHDS